MNTKQRKISVYFFIPDLGGGGTERVIINILRNIDRTKFTPALVLFYKRGIYIRDLPTDIRVIELKKTEIAYGLQWLILFRLMKVLKKEKPQVLLSFLWYPNAIAVLAGFLKSSDTKIIVSERTSTFIYTNAVLNKLRSIVIRWLYPKADIIISPSIGICKDLINKFNIQQEKVEVIYNPVDIFMIQEKALEHLDHPWYHGKGNVITAVGRLGNEKGFYYLIKAAAILDKSSIDFRLVIVGEGRERKSLESLIHELQLGDKVELVGFQQNPYKFLSRSTIFVLSSLYEGFPNVLLEALALGIPSVATRCPTGPEEIITDGVNGILVPTADEHALAGAIKKILNDEDLRRRLGEEGRKRAEDFRVEKIVKQYQEAIESICAESAER